jgi:hypothetical protein
MQSDPFFLEAPPNAIQRRNARFVVLGLTATFLITVPFTSLALPQSPAVIVVFGTAFLICDLVTAILLVVQFSITRRLSLLAIATG